MSRTLVVTSLTALLIAACGGGTTPSAASAQATAKASDACANRPPESAADYQAKLSTFKSAAGFAPSFTQGQVLNDGEEIAITVSEAGFSDNLGFDAFYLGDCTVHVITTGNFYRQPDGRWTTPMPTGTGSDIPDGTPAFIAVMRHQLLPSATGGMPSLKSTVVGEYAVRINNPKRD